MHTINTAGAAKITAETLVTMHFNCVFASRAEYLVVVLDWGDSVTFEVYCEQSWDYTSPDNKKGYHSTIRYEAGSTWGSVTTYRPYWNSQPGTQERVEEFAKWDRMNKELEIRVLTEMGIID